GGSRSRIWTRWPRRDGGCWSSSPTVTSTRSRCSTALPGPDVLVYERTPRRFSAVSGLNSTDLVTFGETMALFAARRTGPLRFARDFDLGLGGAESNVAIGVTRLGRTACWIGRVGADEFGDLIRATLTGEGVIVRAIPDPDAPTGLMIKGRRTADHIDVRYYRSGSAGSRIRPDDLDVELIRTARALHVSAISPALSESARSAVRHAVAEARAAGVAVSLDVNYRRALWSKEAASAWLREVVGQVDVLFATEDEARLVTGAPARTADPAPP